MAGYFCSTLDLRLRGYKKWWTLAPLVYVSGVAKQRITVPAEFITDLASVPRLPLAYMIAGDRAPGPATVHDYLYQLPSWEDRPLADAILLEAMACDQPALGFEPENPAIRRLMWAGVRAGGWAPWNAHRARSADLNPIWHRDGFPQTA